VYHRYSKSILTTLTNPKLVSLDSVKNTLIFWDGGSNIYNPITHSMQASLLSNMEKVPKFAMHSTSWLDLYFLNAQKGNSEAKVVSLLKDNR
jgi:hypothetical protein